jgi:Holliday junction DNA helicase RuvA
LPALGEETLLHIESQWSESAGLRLYGFGTREDRKAFVLLQAIQGVGPKAAMAVLDVLSPAELASAVAREDKAAVGRANGVGPKLALRIVTELKDKPITDGPVLMSAPAASAAASAPAKPAPTGDAVAALMGLGVAEVNARRVVEAAADRLGEEATVQALIKAGLQELGR